MKSELAWVRIRWHDHRSWKKDVLAVEQKKNKKYKGGGEPLRRAGRACIAAVAMWHGSKLVGSRFSPFLSIVHLSLPFEMFCFLLSCFGVDDEMGGLDLQWRADIAGVARKCVFFMYL